MILNIQSVQNQGTNLADTVVQKNKHTKKRISLIARSQPAGMGCCSIGNHLRRALP